MRAGFRIERSDDRTAIALAGEADHHHAVCHQRPAIAAGIRAIGDGDIPRGAARARIQRDHVQVGRGDDQLIAPQGDGLFGKRRGVFWQLPVVAPQLPPGRCIEGEHLIAEPEHIHHPVAHQRLAHRRPGGQGLRPCDAEIADVFGRNLGEGGETLPHVPAPPCQPVFWRGVAQHRLGHGGVAREPVRRRRAGRERVAVGNAGQAEAWGFAGRRGGGHVLRGVCCDQVRAGAAVLRQQQRGQCGVIGSGQGAAATGRHRGADIPKQFAHRHIAPPGEKCRACERSGELPAGQVRAVAGSAIAREYGAAMFDLRGEPARLRPCLLGNARCAQCRQSCCGQQACKSDPHASLSPVLGRD